MHEVLEYILPVVFSSGEAMIALMIFIILLIVGRGKLLPSEKMLFIERRGRYSMMLAPGLNLAQNFIENIADQSVLHGEPQHEGLQLRFEVRDEHIATKQRPAYRLLISTRNGVFHFEAMHDVLESPHAIDGQTRRDAAVSKAVTKAVYAVAKARGIEVNPA